MTEIPNDAAWFAVDAEARTVRGILMPYDEMSRTSITNTPPVKFAKGDLRVPPDLSIVSLNRRHARYDVIGHAAAVADVDAPVVGMFAEFRVARTPAGDKFLADHEGLVKLSPEVLNLVRRGDGSATGDLVGAAVVPEGAFASAALFEIRPDDVDDDAADSEVPSTPAASSPEVPSTPEPLDVADVEATDDPADPDDPENESEDAMGDALVPNTFGTPGTPPDPDNMSRAEMFAALSMLATNRADDSLIDRMRKAWGGVPEASLFALNDVKYNGTGGLANNMVRPQWLDEVLDGTTYVPRFAPLFGHKDLTALAMSGWRWTTKPAGGAWSGNKAAIPSNAPAVEAVSENASRWAGGHDHAREHVDFGTPGYFEAYYAAMIEDYFRWLDETVVLTEALAAATTIEADNPAGLAIGAAMSALIDGAAAVVTAGLIPTFAVLPTASWKSILKTPSSDVLGYLNAQLGLDEGTLNDAGFVIRGSDEVDNTLVGSRSAADVYELPGSPVRAEALNIANGGIDTGLYGYGGLFVKNAAGIVEVTPYTP